MLPIAISPCPNDTFLFHAWIHHLVGEELPPLPTYADIETLNQWAIEGRFPLIKVSFHCLGKILENYQLLPVGAALGQNCGPKIIANETFPLEEIKHKRIAIPGEETTANLLFSTLVGEAKERVYCRYDEIGTLLRDGVVDCGVIIHETRFLFAKRGFVEIADLGTLWQQEFSLPLPLGCLAARKDLSSAEISLLIEIMKDSLQYAWQHPEASREFILKHSREKDPKVVQQHISLYVNKETEGLSHEGLKAVETLLRCGEKLGFYRTSRPYEAADICPTC